MDKRSTYIQPRKAFQCIDNANFNNINIYIYGITGCGKTELIKRYLSKEEYIYIDTKFIDEEQLDIPVSSNRTIVVIDNLHELSQMEMDTRGIRDKICDLVDREDIWLIIAGRSNIPAWITKSLYNGAFSLITEKQLMIDETNVRKLYGKYKDEVQEEFLKIVIKRGMGHAFSQVIAANEYIIMRDEGFDPAQDRNINEYMRRIDERVYAHLNAHVYDQWDVQVHQFLLEMSIVDEFDVALARMITGRNDVEKMIEKAYALGNFFEPVKEDQNGEKIYAYIYFFKDSMRKRLDILYTVEQRKMLYTNAGLFYETRGEIFNALNMYEKFNDEEHIANTLINNDRNDAGNAGYFELKKYYLALSENKAKSSVELMSSLSMIYSLMLNVEMSEKWYNELKTYAENQTGNMRMQAKSQLIRLDIALPHRGSTDVLNILKNAYVLFEQRKLIMKDLSITSKLPSQMNGGKDFCEWSKKDREIAKSIGKIITLLLRKHGRAVVNLALAESFFEKNGDNFEVITLLNRGRMQAETEGNIEQVFVADGILAWSMIFSGKVAEAKETLEEFKIKAKLDAKICDNVDAFIARCNLYKGDVDANNTWMENAPNEELEFITFDRFKYLTKIRVYILNGKYELALNLCIKMQYYAEVMKRKMIEMEVKLLLAIVSEKMGSDMWKQYMREVLDDAYEYHFVKLIAREGKAVQKLVEKCEWDVEEDKDKKKFLKEVILETTKMAKQYPDYLENKEDVNLSETGIKFLSLLAQGYTKNQIAEELNLTMANVKYHTSQVYKKLGVGSKAAAVSEAKRRGLI